MTQTPARDKVLRALRRGLTLIEMMVVLVILGLVGALIATNVTESLEGAKVKAARTDVGTIVSALKLYKLDNGRFPEQGQGLTALVTRPSSGAPAPAWRAYLNKLPADPWGGQYQYLNPGVKGEVDVFSFGKDGKAGGEGDDADIGSWQ